MYKYTLKNHWKHYYTQYGKYSRNYVQYETVHKFLEAGLPDHYGIKWLGLSAAYDIVFYSKKPLRHVPCAGYLIPVSFFDEVKVD